MNKLKISLLILVFFTKIYADEIKLGASFLKMNYVETGKSGQFLDSEKSDYTDIDGFSISYRKDIGNLNSDNQLSSLEFSLRQLKGSSNYDGFLQNNGVIVAPHKSITQNKIFESKIRLARTMYSANYDISLFTSLGNREWTRDMSGDKYGFKEFYDWKYYDVGFKTTFYDGHWELGFELGYQKAINPTMIAYMSKVRKFDLGDVSGHYYKIPLGYNFDKNLKLELEYEYDKWTIGASNIVDGYYEPDSVTKNKIVSLNLSYKF